MESIERKHKKKNDPVEFLPSNSFVTSEYKHARTHIHFGTYFDSIHGHEENPKGGGCQTGGHGFESHIHVLGSFDIVQQGEDAGIGGRISESGQGTLNQGGQDTTIKTRNATIGINRFQSLWKGSTVAILIIDLAVGKME